MRKITEDERAEFHENGFVVLRGIISPTRIALLRQGAIRATAERAQQRKERADEISAMRAAEARGEVILPATRLHVVEQMYQLWERFPEMRRHALDPRLAQIAADVLGVRRLRLWFDQVMIKNPGDGPTPFHQDNAYAPFDLSCGGCVTLWVPLAPVNESMGSLRYVTGSHRCQVLAPLPLTAVDSIASLLPQKGRELAGAFCTRLSLGDALLHHGTTIHGAGANRSGQARPAFLTSYFCDGARRLPGMEFYPFDRDGISAGQVVNGPSTPVVTLS
jgi:ectoine hydroxylase-related dioxygenase (phytanoyl-CoA dioxygenase family)